MHQPHSGQSRTPEPTATPEATPGTGVQVLVGDEQYVTVTLAEPWAGTDQIKPASGNVFITVNIWDRRHHDHVVHLG